MRHPANQTMSLFKASLLATALALGGAPMMSAQAQLPDFVQTIKDVSPAVVNISTTQKRPKMAQGTARRRAAVPRRPPVQRIVQAFLRRPARRRHAQSTPGAVARLGFHY